MRRLPRGDEGGEISETAACADVQKEVLQTCDDARAIACRRDGVTA